MDPLNSLKAKETAISLSQAWLYYFASLLICILCGLILLELQFVELTIIPYFCIGIFLNRKVLRNLVKFHPIYDTLTNVSNTKLTAIVVWPVFYVVIFIKLAIVKYL